MPNEDGTPTQEELTAQAAADAAKETKPPEPEFVSKAEYNTLLSQVSTLATLLAESGKKLEVFDKVAEILTGKPAETLTKEEQVVVGELKRLMPHILPNAPFLDHAPAILKTVQTASQAASEQLIQAAFETQLTLQQEAGVKIDDPKINTYIAGAIKEYVNQDKTRQARFWRGDRTVIKEGFDEVKTALLDPTRLAGKKQTMEIVGTRPQTRAPHGAAGGGEGEKPLDFRDRKAVRAAFSAALSSS